VKDMPYKNIHPVILAGGKGTRLRSVVSDLPKILAPVKGRPFITYLFEQLISVGFSQVILCTGYMAERVESIIGNQYKGLRIRYSHEETPQDTGGAIRMVAGKCTKDLLIMNGDSFLDVDLRAFIIFHQNHSSEASIILAEMSDCGRYGQVTIGENFLVTNFKEKEPDTGRGFVNAGIYLICRKLLLQILPEGVSSMERDFFPAVAGKSLYGFPCNGKFIDIGLPQTYSEAESFFS
jgi:NDP-sugar pyrophosphorylase family protein